MGNAAINRKLLRAVGIKLARGAPVSTFEEQFAARFRCDPRTVRRYVERVNEQRDIDDAAAVKRARARGRFVAEAACARHMDRADRLFLDAARLLARARRLDGNKGAGARLEAAIEQAGRPVLDDGPEPAPPEDGARSAALLAIARQDRIDAAVLIKRGEAADKRAQDWFEKAQKISGTYEIAPPTPESTRVQLTSPQRRAMLLRIGEAIREHKAKAAAR